MPVFFQTGYSLPVIDQPLTHARIAHSGNWLTGGTITPLSTAAGYFSDGADTSLTYEKWRPDALPSSYIYDHGSDVTCDYCVIAAHTLGTNGCSLSVQFEDAGNVWQDLIATTAVADDGAIFSIFEPATAQRFRVQISNGTPPNIGMIKFGAALQMPRPIRGAHSPQKFARQVVSRTSESETGEFLGRSVQRRATRGAVQWDYLAVDWVEANWLGFQQAVESEPFVIAWRPGRYSDAHFCSASTVPQVEFMGELDLMIGNLSMIGYLSE